MPCQDCRTGRIERLQPATNGTGAGSAPRRASCRSPTRREEGETAPVAAEIILLGGSACLIILAIMGIAFPKLGRRFAGIMPGCAVLMAIGMVIFVVIAFSSRSRR